MKYEVCNKCGCPELQQKVWSMLNTGTYVSDVEPLEYYCPICETIEIKPITETQSIKENDPFTCHGTYTISNAIGVEVEFSRDDTHARWKYTDSKNEVEISKWFEVEFYQEYCIEEKNPEPRAVFDREGLCIYLDEVIKIDNG